MEENEWMALTAHLEGQAVIVKNIGKKIKVSEMELVCLCNFAWIGMMHTLSTESEDEDIDGDAFVEIELIKQKIRKTFANEVADGINRLAQSTAAMLSNEKFEKYIVSRE